MQTLPVLINPASGQDEPVLARLNRVFRACEVDWEAHVSTHHGDVGRMAARAARAGAPVVAVYGGDGTVSEAAYSLLGTPTALAILPGGTGNAVAQELGVPTDLEAAARSACAPGSRVRPLDAIVARGRCFLLRVGVGADARTVAGPRREDKDRLGWLAYLKAALAEIQDPERARYRIEVDDVPAEFEGVACIVGNIGRIGRGGVTLAKRIEPFDGKLDVLCLRSSDLGAATALLARALGGEDQVASAERALPDEPVVHLQGARVRIEADPPQPVHGDGESLDPTPIDLELVPGALRVVLPEDADVADGASLAGATA